MRSRRCVYSRVREYISCIRINVCPFCSCLQSALLPLGPTTIPDAVTLPHVVASASRDGWLPFSGLQLIIAAQGQAQGDCVLNASSPGVTGLEFGSSHLTVLSNGATSINIIACADCIFGPASSFSAYLPYTCQSLLLGIVTTDATGSVSLQSVSVPPVQGQLLSAITWGATPLLQVRILTLQIVKNNVIVFLITSLLKPLYTAFTLIQLFATLIQIFTDAISGVNQRGTQVLSGSLSITTSELSEMPILVPNVAAIRLHVGLAASQLYASVTVTEKQSVVQVRIDKREWPLVSLILKSTLSHVCSYYHP